MGVIKRGVYKAMGRPHRYHIILDGIKGLFATVVTGVLISSFLVFAVLLLTLASEFAYAYDIISSEIITKS